jgi:uncharacterized repeat protein (TIGR01451 family)
MKKTNIYFPFIFLFFNSFFIELNAQNITCTASGASCYCKLNDADNLVKTLNLKNPPSGRGKADIDVFWDMGDGQNRTGKSFTYTYKKSGNYTVRAFFRIKYSLYPPIKHEESQVLAIKVKSEDPSVYSGNFSLTNSLDGDIVKNEDFCIVASVPKAGDLILDYSPSQFEIGDVRGPEGARLTTRNKIESKGSQRIFIPIKATNLGENGQIASIKMIWNGQSIESKFKVKASHDPNDINVDRSRLRFSEFDGKTEIPIKYTIRFENKGGDLARDVRINVALPQDMTYNPKTSLLEYGYGTIVENPRLPKDADLPLCTSAKDRCFEVVYGAKEDNALGFEFHQIKLNGTNVPDKKMREGFVSYNLFITKPPVRSQKSSADIYFDGVLKPVSTNTVTVALKTQRRLSLRLAANTRLPANKDSVLNYEVGLVWSRLYPFGFYFPTELGVSIKNQFWKDANADITGIPFRFSQQIRHNFLGGLLGFGVGVSANIAANVQRTEGSQKTSKIADLTDISMFGDLNINALRQRPTLGVRLGFPVNKKFEALNNANAQAQVYLAWQFK